MSGIYNWDSWGYFSAFMLMAWVPFTYVLFGRYRPTRAASISILGAIMFLPMGAKFDFPILPFFNKVHIATIAAFFAAYRYAPARMRLARFPQGLDWLIVIRLLGTIGTVATNLDELHYGSWHVTTVFALKWQDLPSMIISEVTEVLMPVVLGRAMMRSREDLRMSLHLLAAAGLVYAPFMLYEVRMSPMLHQLVYGYTAFTMWLQNVRQGGYRPTVFLGHGLVVAFLAFLAFSAAATLYAAGRRKMWGVSMGVVTLFLFVMIVVCKSSAALIYAALFYVAVRRMSIPALGKLTMVLSVIVVLYPVLRIQQIFPAKGLVELSNSMSPERGESLQFRFDNEDVLAQKAIQRPIFGWGGYGRDRVYDPDEGRDITVQDGYWVIEFGARGYVGFFTFFLLLVAPVAYVMSRLSRVPDKIDRRMLAGLSLTVVFCAVNMLPNGWFQAYPYFLAGGLTAAVDAMSQRTPQPAAAKPVKQPLKGAVA
jgi:hypothetical protein